MKNHKLLLAMFVIISLLEALLFAVVFTGWSSYIFILIDKGFYSDLCSKGNITTPLLNRFSNNTKNTTNFTGVTSLKDIDVNVEKRNTGLEKASCEQQQEQLNLFYSISIVVIQILIVVWGILIYRFGILKPKLLSMLVYIGGSLTLAFTTPDTALLIVPGLICVGFGGMAILVLNMKVASFLPYGSRIYTSLLTGAGISSAITFRIVKLLYDNDISDKFGFIGTSILHLIIGGLSTVLHTVFDKLHNGEVVIELEVPELSKSNGTLDSHSELICNITMESHLTLKHSVCRFVTITHLMWYSILLTMMYMYIGTINQRLEENVLPDQVSHFTNMMAYITLSGTITSLIPGGVAELQQKMYTGATNRKETEIIQHILPLTITSGLAIVLSSLSFSAAPSTFYVEFVVLTIFTSFLFASNMTFIASVYPMKHNQFIFALSASVGGIISSIQYGLFRWYNMYDGAHLHVRICMIILAILTLVHPVSVLCSAKDFSKDKTCCKGKLHTIYVSKTETTKM